MTDQDHKQNTTAKFDWDKITEREALDQLLTRYVHLSDLVYKTNMMLAEKFLKEEKEGQKPHK